MKKQILVTAMALLIGLSFVIYSGARPSAAASPDRWEYKILDIESIWPGPIEKTALDFNKLGVEGWEYCSGYGVTRFITFKRKLP